LKPVSINSSFQPHQIGLVIPWYGPLPAYFPMFIQSVKGQPIDIIFVTDQEISFDLPSNFKVYPIAFSQLKEQFETTIGFALTIPRPYKLCDFKPAYGLLFQDILKPYTFWGTIDIDMVLGNLSSSLSGEFLSSIDFLSGLKHYVAGSFFLLRNEPYFNKLFTKSRSWKEVFTRTDMVSFTECNKHWHELKAGANLLTLHTPVESFTEVLLKEQLNGMRLCFEDIVLEPKGLQPAKVTPGRVFYGGKEYVLLHLLYFKTRQKFTHNIRHSKGAYFVNSFGTFSRHPAGFNFLVSRNWLVALQRKLIIQWQKIMPIN
jgi:hypothetical protein